jgi:hypothetical protein
MGGFKRIRETCRGAIAGVMVVLAAACSGCVAEPLDPDDEVLLDEPGVSEEADESEVNAPQDGNEQDEPTPIPWVEQIRPPGAGDENREVD